MEYVNGDLIKLADDGQFDVIVHGANCFNTMGSGIAKSIRARWPAVYVVDCTTASGDYNKLGTYTSVAVNDCSLVVVNAYTQYGFNKNGERQDLFEYTSFELILQKLAHTFPGARFGFPLIGQGLGGGDARRILTLIADFDDIVSPNGGSVTVVELAK